MRSVQYIRSKRDDTDVLYGSILASPSKKRLDVILFRWKTILLTFSRRIRVVTALLSLFEHVDNTTNKNGDFHVGCRYLRCP